MLPLLLIAVLVGALLPVQAGINAQLRTDLGHPLWAAVASFGVGTVALLCGTAVARLSPPTAEAMSRTPASHLVGGLIGAAYILAAVILAPRLGAATLLAASVSGQMVASLALDSYGLAGFMRQPLTLPRIAGALFVVVGVLLIQRR